MLLAASRLKTKKVQNFILSIFVTAVVEIRRGDSKLCVWRNRWGFRKKSAHSQILKSSFIHSLYIYLSIHSQPLLVAYFVNKVQIGITALAASCQG
jgi:hypothetical protein